MFRIRFHGRGGQGIKTASRVLGSAFFNAGYEVQDAPRYGAERRGAPLFAYVRANRRPIAERGIIQHPDLVVVADDSLVAVPAAGVLQGLDRHSVLLINSHDSAADWRHRLNLAGPVLILPASEEVEDRAGLPYVGSACAGAAAHLAAIDREHLVKALRQELAHVRPDVLERNLAIALQAYDQMAEQAGRVTEGRPTSAKDFSTPDWISLAHDDVMRSAPTVHGAATSVQLKTGLWRTMRPVIDYELCNRCWWVCSTFCPDAAILVDTDGRPDIDYDHCKGCLICVSRCPPHAITAIPEHLAEDTEGEPS